MAEISCIHIEEITDNSEPHNLRTSYAENVVKFYTPDNESILGESITERKKQVQKLYEENVGQKMQAKTKMIREGVVLLQPHHTMDDITRLVHAIRNELGITCFQAHIHRDEGHFERKKIIGIPYGKPQFVPNLHAHLVFDYQDKTTGKTIKLRKPQLARLQDITAEVLGMQRGKSTNKKHIKSDIYRLNEQKKQLEQEKTNLKSEISKISLFKQLKIFIGDKLPKSNANAYIAELNSEIKQLTKRYLNAENTITAKNSTIADRDKEIMQITESLNNKIKLQLHNQKTTMNSQITNLECKLSDANKKLDKYKPLIDEFEKFQRQNKPQQKSQSRGIGG